ncbi:MAG: metal ABC transporter substrate-binding protein, partial [Rubrobacter sp.]|nr:metal ABC transporter substrate-binding protein [Rubrobacter sp.]
MKRLGKLTAIGVLAFAAAGCGSASGGGDDGSGGSGGSSSASESGGEVQVAATMSVLQDMTEQVGGERVEVSTIAPVGATVETFQPSPSDAQKISEADLVVENGTGLESWLDDLVESAGGSDKPVATLSEDLEPIEGGEGSHEEHSDEEHSDEEHSEERGSGDGHGHAHAGGNPHFWLDVENAEHYV